MLLFAVLLTALPQLLKATAGAAILHGHGYCYCGIRRWSPCTSLRMR
jgi:hypothetical protein